MIAKYIDPHTISCTWCKFELPHKTTTSFFSERRTVLADINDLGGDQSAGSFVVARWSLPSDLRNNHSLKTLSYNAW